MNTYKNNSASILMYKSARINAKTTDFININHLIMHDGGRAPDSRILDQFIGTIERIIYCAKKFNSYLEMSAFITAGKKTQYINANNDIYADIERIRYHFPRVKYSTIEQIINAVYDIYALVYPYNRLNRREIHNNASIKYLINEYYHK